MRLLDEQERPKPPKADTPEAREARIQAHAARIEALGLSGDAWEQTNRMNSRHLRTGKSLAQLRAEAAAERERAGHLRLSFNERDDRALALFDAGWRVIDIANELGMRRPSVYHCIRRAKARRGERRARGEAA